MDNVNNQTITTTDYLLLADDAAIEFKNINDILVKLRTYDNVANCDNFLINWDKVYILTANKNINKVKNIIQQTDRPTNKIKRTTSSKLLGRITNNNNLNETINERINKANFDCGTLRNENIVPKDINAKLRLRLFDSLIGIIRIYSLHIIPLRKST